MKLLNFVKIQNLLLVYFFKVDLIKKFLRELKEPLVPIDYYHLFFTDF